MCYFFFCLSVCDMRRNFIVLYYLILAKWSDAWLANEGRPIRVLVACDVVVELEFYWLVDLQ